MAMKPQTPNRSAKGSLPTGVKIPKEPTGSTMQSYSVDQKGRTKDIGKRMPLETTRISADEFEGKIGRRIKPISPIKPKR